ncbi:MAG TPA: hypothetical protein VJU86_14150 [Pyrinomonadaceae bacterium]|nr:hypothetical protein [Pyrinomonadaceae bacterium]
MKNEEIAKLDFSGWPLSDEYLIEIGRVCALWAQLESFLNICIGKLAGFNDLSDPKAFILITHSSFPQRLDILGTLCEQLLPEFPSLTGYKEVVGDLKAAQKLRNNFTHNGMALNEETGFVEMPIGSARGSLKVTVEKITIADIRRATIAISEAHAALYKLVLQKDLQPAWKRRAAKGRSD